MAVLSLLFVLVQSLIQYPQSAGDGLDEVMHQRMQERQELLDGEMARLLQELEQGPLEQQDEGWGALLLGALQQWPFWLLAGALLLLGLWFSCRRRSSEANSSSGKDWSSWETLRDQRGEDQEDDSGDSKEGEENIDVSVEADDSGREGSDREGSSVSANGADNDDVTEGDDDVKVEDDSYDKEDYGYDLKTGNSVDSMEGGENVDLTVEADDSLPPQSDEGNDREGSPVPANDGGDDDVIEGTDDVKVEDDSYDKEDYGYDLKTGNSIDSKEGGENIDLTVEADDSQPPQSDEGNDREGSPVPANGADNDVTEGDDDVKVKDDSYDKEGYGYDLKTGNSVDSMEGGENVDLTMEADDSLPPQSDEGNDREGSPVSANGADNDDVTEGDDDVKVEDDSYEKEDYGYDLKTGNSVDSMEGGENIDLTMEADDSLPPQSDEGNDREGSPVSANDGGNDDVIEGTDDVKTEEDSDVKRVSGYDLKNAEAWSDGNVPGDNTAEGSEEEPGSVAGNTEVLDAANEGEDKDVQVEDDKDFGKEEEGNGSEEKTSREDMKAGNNDDVDEGEDNVDGKEEYTVVKVQESSDASEQRSSVCTEQEDSSVEGKEADHTGFPGTEKEKTEVIKGDNDRNKDEEQGGVNVGGNKNEDRKEDKQGNMAASAKEGSDGGNEGRGSGRTEERENTRDVGKKRGILLADRIEWPVQDVERGCSVIAELMDSLTRVFVDCVSNSFYPVPQDAIGLGTAFEGWTPRDWDGVYHVLVPLNPPPGHAFQLELDSAGQMAARTFRVRVELECTCRREQPGEKLLCFLHHSQKKLRRKHKRSLLETLCTGCYLDVEKTSHWFYQLVKSSWLHVPQSSSWHLVFQPCRRSCQFQLSKGRMSLTVEMLFGVRQGASDIFVISQHPEAQKGGSSIFVSSQPGEANFPASTVWPETYAVAEAKFLWHVATQVPSEGLHLKCLQVFTCILRGTGFSSAVWKTVVMHMLTTVPLCRWHSREFERRLWDIMTFLRRCLQSKRLEHFVLGTERLPAEISLPPAKPRVEPCNLFEHLARDPATHRKAMQAYGQLRFRLRMLLSMI